MKKTILYTFVLCLALLIGCVDPNDTYDFDEAEDEHGVDDVHEEEHTDGTPHVESDEHELGEEHDDGAAHVEGDEHDGLDESASLGVPTIGNEDVEEMVVATGSEVRDFTIEAKQWEFVPGTITVNEGDTVKLTITSTDVAHGFNLPDFGINERLEPNQPVDVEFVADKTGTFSYSCSVPCGSGHGGMSGQLIVE